jgi:hypothetical protein
MFQPYDLSFPVVAQRQLTQGDRPDAAAWSDHYIIDRAPGAILKILAIYVSSFANTRIQEPASLPARLGRIVDRVRYYALRARRGATFAGVDVDAAENQLEFRDRVISFAPRTFAVDETRHRGYFFIGRPV